MTLHRSGRTSRQHGFTLIEVLIVVVIVGLLASIAFPSYRNYIVRTHETVAKTALAEAASTQQNFYNDRRRYGADLTQVGYAAASVYLAPDGSFATAQASDSIYRMEVRTGATNTYYVLDAVPVGNQATASKCGTLSLDARDARSASGPSGDLCW